MAGIREMLLDNFLPCITLESCEAQYTGPIFDADFENGHLRVRNVPFRVEIDFRKGVS